MFVLLGDIHHDADLLTSSQAAISALKELLPAEAVSVPEKVVGASIEEIQLCEHMAEVFVSHGIPMPFDGYFGASPMDESMS